MENDIIVLSKAEYKTLLGKQNIITIKTEKLECLPIKDFRIHIDLQNPILIGEIAGKVSESCNIILNHIRTLVKRENDVLSNREKNLNILQQKVDKDFKDLSKSIDFIKKQEQDRMCIKIANMSYWKRRKFLKQWKQK